MAQKAKEVIIREARVMNDLQEVVIIRKAEKMANQTRTNQHFENSQVAQ